VTLDQATAFGIIGCTIALFVSGRLPYDLVALMALLAGVVTGVVPAKSAFAGLGDDVVIIVATALIVSAAISRSGVVETLMRPLLPYLKTEQAQVPALVIAVTVMSMVTKNVGALAIFMPVALQLARRTGTSVSKLLMPMAFGSLVGGVVTLIGTSPNIIIAKVRQDVTGYPFGMFDFTPVGLCIAVLGMAFLSFAYRLLPGGRKATAGINAAFNLEGYVAEASLPADSPLVGKTVAALEAFSDGEVIVSGIVRERFRRFLPTPAAALRTDDVLMLEGEPESLERLVARGRLRLANDVGEGAETGQSVVEGVVTRDSALLGRTPDAIGLRDRYHVALLAVSRSGERVGQRLHALRFRAGDVVVLKGASGSMSETLGALRVLPLAARAISLGQSHRGWLPPVVLAVAMALVALNLIPVAIAFFAAAVVLLVARVLTMEEAYYTMEWHVLILLAALIPVSEAVRDTGGTDLLAGWLERALHSVPATGALAIIMAIAMLVTPFLHNAPTALMLGPIAGTLAGKLGLNPDPFLMAVALGCACDFLSPIGHQCNTLVMGPGGYRFGDYWRLGLPLSIVVVAAGVPLIAFFWPLAIRS